MGQYPGAYGYGNEPPVVNKPGVGVAIGLIGLAMFILAVVALPWVAGVDGGEDAKLDDFSDMPEEVAEASDAEVISAYADGLWIAVAVGLTICVVTSTLAVPQSQGGRVALGVITAGLLGLLHLADRRGTWAHRVCGAVATCAYGLLHAVAVADVFTVEGESSGLDAGAGILVGFLGLLVILAGCIVGTRAEKPQAYGHGYR